jgi:RNA polymerase sigma factor (sigma-70 family)
MYKSDRFDRGRGVDSSTEQANRIGTLSADSFSDFFDREVLGQVQRATLLLGSAEEANDVVQEAMVRLYQRWDQVDEPGSYLNRTVLNLCRDWGRRQVVGHRVQVMVKTATAPSVGSDVPPGTELLGDVLAELPFSQRAAVVLKYWGGLSTAEIANELGCSTGSVGPWITRALLRLREALS